MASTTTPVRVGGTRGLTSPAGPEDFTRQIGRHGYAVTEPMGRMRPANHYIIGVGVGHDDAAFCEERPGSGYGSMADYYENGEAFEGRRWWEDTDQIFSVGVKYYGCSQ